MTRAARFVLFVLALTASSCGGAPRGASPEPPPAGPATPDAEAPGEPDVDDDPGDEIAVVDGVRALTAGERAGLRRMLRLTERVRELRFLRPVRVEVESQARITERFLEELADEDLEEMRVAYVALGLLAADIDLVGLLGRVLGEQVVGYYDTDADRLVVRDDVMPWVAKEGRFLSPAQREARLVVLHELVHALQDQHFDLNALEPDDLVSDVALARRSLVEGDATLAIVAHSFELLDQPLATLTQRPDALDRLVAMTEAFEDGAESAELRAAPPIVRDSLILPYTAGTRFAGTLHGRGGWASVDRAFAAPPASMEHVLHPAKHLAGEGPDAVSVPELPTLEEAGYRRLDVDTLGEAELALYLGQGLPGDRDSAAAAGWSGDALAVHAAPTGTAAAIWFTAWDDTDEAAEAEVAARRVQGLVPASDQRPFRVARRGRAVLIVRHLPPAFHRPVRRAFDAFARALPASPPVLDAPQPQG